MDPAWTLRGTSLVVSNWVGRSGAWIADVMLSLFGVMAYAIPVALVVGGLRTLKLVAWEWPVTSLRAAGWLIGILCGSVLARLHVASSLGLPAGPGGVIGGWLGHAGLPGLDWVGLPLPRAVGPLTGR